MADESARSVGTPGRPDDAARAEKGQRPGAAPYVALAAFALIAWAVAVIWALRAGCREDTAVGGQAVDGAGEVRIDLNRASAEELQVLSGIGPVLSRRIVEERGRLGGFRSADDLLRVRGVTKELVRRLRPFVKAGPPVRRSARSVGTSGRPDDAAPRGEAGGTGSEH